jgi:hypothetical protein
MITSAPIAALLWENWKLTRVEACQRLGLGIVLASAALGLSDNGATVALVILFSLHAVFYLSIAKLNGGRFVDGYKPGFPLYLLYTRPVPTGAFVGVAMAYDAISSAAFYLLIAALLMLVFGQPIPLLPVALLIVAVHLASTCVQWSTRSRVIQWIGTAVITLPTFFLVRELATSPQGFEFSLAEYVLMFLIGVVSVALTVAGVARQRRGDTFATMPRAAASGGYADWLVSLFRFPCPTSSASKAQAWFELKSSGFPALAIGLAVALLVFLLFAISIPVAVVRPIAVFGAMISGPTLLVLLSGNAFGIRRRQGRTYASALEMTQPYGTSELAGIKLLVRTACLLGALIAVSVSVWASSALVSAWEAGAGPGLMWLPSGFGATFAGQMAYSYVAQAVMVTVIVALIVASLAAFSALRARYPGPLFIAGSLLLLHVLVLVLLAMAEKKGIASSFLVGTIFAVTGWSLVVAIVSATIYLFWIGLAERALTIRYVSVALLISAAFAAAWLTVLHTAGVQLAGMSVAGVVGVLWPVLLPALASFLAPWSLSRVRHT